MILKENKNDCRDSISRMQLKKRLRVYSMKNIILQKKLGSCDSC